MTTVAITGNTFPVKEALKALGGRWDPGTKAWMVPAARAKEAWALVPPAASKPKPAATNVGDFAGVLALFERARTGSGKGRGLKKPAILLGWEKYPGAKDKLGDAGVTTVKLKLLTEKSSTPGWVTVEATKDNGFFTAAGWPDRDWYGRISPEGVFTPGAKAAKMEPKLSETLRALAEKPAETATEIGRLTGRCAFCNLPLTAEESTGAGYGRTCAKRYGLTWGAATRHNVFTAEAASGAEW